MTKFLFARPLFPVDAASVKRRLAFLWWEPFVLLLPWRYRVGFWNWLFDCDFDWRKASDPFMLQWLQNYWPFGAAWLPESLHRAVMAYCFPDAAGKVTP